MSTYRYVKLGIYIGTYNTYAEFMGKQQYKMTPFPLTEIYHYVLNEGWRIRELWRKDGEIRLCVYIYSQGMEDFVKKTGLDWEDAINQTKHLEYSIYENEG